MRKISDPSMISKWENLQYSRGFKYVFSSLDTENLESSGWSFWTAIILNTTVVHVQLYPGELEVQKMNGKLWIAMELKERKVSAPSKGLHFGKEIVSYWKLNVTILKAKTSSSKDYFSESDYYVTLCLPTATASAFNTTTVHNKCNPEWNETFTFRIPSHLKNVLEIKLHDEDPVSHDDHISTVLFDLSNLTFGKKERIAFNLNSETKDYILIQFEMIHSEEPSCDYLSNGILLAAPFTVLDISVDNLLNNSDFLGKILKLHGAYPENQSFSAKELTKLRFYINRDLETELGVASSAVDPTSSSTRLQPLPPEHTSKVSLVIDKDTVDLIVETHECVDDQIAVHLDFDIPQQEKEYLKKRKLIVRENMQKLFGLDSPPSLDQVPTIALVCSGGGSRAMTGLFGSLKSLKEINVLDTVSYITGVSGSTWAMTALGQHESWSQDGIDSTIAEIRKEISKDLPSAFSLEKLEYYKQELEEKNNEGHILSHTDVGGLMFEHFIFGKKITSTLSEQQKTINQGQNPFPIYTAVNMKEKTGCEPEAEWCEFTPYEVGFQKYGAFVRAEDFGSQFFLGHLVQKLPEVRIPYLIEPENESTLDTQLIDQSTAVSTFVSDCMRNRPISSKVYNFMNGLFLHSDYNTNSNFIAWKETHPDAFPNLLTPSDSILQLVDSGHAINIGCPPILRTEREVDVIIALDNSWHPDNIFKDIKLTAVYCKDHDIPFPNIDFNAMEGEPCREVYIFEDKDNPRAPIVIHFPLVNNSFRHFKQPDNASYTHQDIVKEMELMIKDGFQTSWLQQPESWTFFGSMFFVCTVFSTVGYGAIYPVTLPGKVVCVLYAMVGIPLMLLVMVDVGDFLATTMTKAYIHIHAFFEVLRSHSWFRLGAQKQARESNHQTLEDGTVVFSHDVAVHELQNIREVLQSQVNIKSNSIQLQKNGEIFEKIVAKENLLRTGPLLRSISCPELNQMPALPKGFSIQNLAEIGDTMETLNVPFVLILFIVFTYIFFGGLILPMWETQMKGFDPYYFCFITITTIGFGDIVPHHPKFFMLTSLFIISGMAIMSMAFKLSQTRLVNFYRQCIKIIGRENRNEDKK
ncbi:cytosolic phospholipase A2 zeta-like isoform X2 [Syngnathoides biaculeatus]|uniref:cytosolic phospholipase A2 zeta-like isoform X2 n=1 Tax=Syngnathoides biaculeatus TaxID=300417 RepID=UPI002ADD995E|nr:cytosolic phospholipase A2 zeta-like isoform X2 [Syngnathoides biaculeatus]